MRIYLLFALVTCAFAMTDLEAEKWENEKLKESNKALRDVLKAIQKQESVGVLRKEESEVGQTNMCPAGTPPAYVQQKMGRTWCACDGGTCGNGCGCADGWSRCGYCGGANGVGGQQGSCKSGHVGFGCGSGGCWCGIWGAVPSPPTSAFVKHSGAGWCSSTTPSHVAWQDSVANIGSKTDSQCWNTCKQKYPNEADLNALFLNDGSYTACWCQADCKCTFTTFGVGDLLSSPSFVIPNSCYYGG